MTEEPDDPRAAEYVLGTLRGPERDAFERELEGSVHLRGTVAEWEKRLGGLNDLVAPVAPPPRTWQAVNARLGHARPPRGEGIGLWRGLAMFATAVSLVLAVVLVRELAVPPVEVPVEPPGVQAVVVRGERQQPLWLVKVDWAAGSVSAEAVAAEPAGEGKDHELWLLGGSQEPPLSLGLLPAQGRLSRAVERLAERRPSATGVAVSLEPAGGSPTGQPTGPVLYSEPLGGPAAI